MNKTPKTPGAEVSPACIPVALTESQLHLDQDAEFSDIYYHATFNRNQFITLKYM